MREIIFGVAGGLALFIYGMNLMGEGLKKTAGDRMRSILASVTRNPLMAVGVGALVTAIIELRRHYGYDHWLLMPSDDIDPGYRDNYRRQYWHHHNRTIDRF